MIKIKICITENIYVYHVFIFLYYLNSIIFKNKLLKWNYFCTSKTQFLINVNKKKKISKFSI